MSGSSSSTYTKFCSLNRRYMRSLDSKVIIYEGGGQHVQLHFKELTAILDELNEIVSENREMMDGGLRSSADVMMFELIAAQLSEILLHWRKTITRPARYGIPSDIDSEDDGMCIHTIDVDICEGLDTLKALEDKAESCIPHYERILVPVFQSEPCKCDICEPSIRRRRWHWACAQKYFRGRIPAPVFERMFAGLREDAEGTRQ